MGFCVAQFPRPNSFGGWSHARTQLRPDFLRRTALFTEVRVSMRRYVAAALFLITLPHVTPASAYNDPLGRGLMDFVNVLSAKVVPRDVVPWDRGFAPGTVVVSTRERRLYYVLGNKRAIQYGVGVGREGFTWSGTKTVSLKREWPEWRPPLSRCSSAAPICRATCPVGLR